MKTSIYRVLSQTEAQTITKQDGTTLQKSIITLQELGGQYEPTYVATLLGNQVKFYPNDLVIAALRFSSHTYGDNTYQDITVTEIYKLS